MDKDFRSGVWQDEVAANEDPIFEDFGNGARQCRVEYRNT